VIQTFYLFFFTKIGLIFSDFRKKLFLPFLSWQPCCQLSSTFVRYRPLQYALMQSVSELA